jgi:hypothetical protein
MGGTAFPEANGIGDLWELIVTPLACLLSRSRIRMKASLMIFEPRFSFFSPDSRMIPSIVRLAVMRSLSLSASRYNGNRL